MSTKIPNIIGVRDKDGHIVPQQIEMGPVSDGYHTFDELYEYRMLYHAWACKAWIQAGFRVIKSHKHHDGSPAFDGFIVQAELPTGQVSNHYSNKYWDLFDVYEVERANKWDGHTPQIAAQRLRDSLKQVSDE